MLSTVVHVCERVNSEIRAQCTQPGIRLEHARFVLQPDKVAGYHVIAWNGKHWKYQHPCQHPKSGYLHEAYGPREVVVWCPDVQLLLTVLMYGQKLLDVWPGEYTQQACQRCRDTLIKERVGQLARLCDDLNDELLTDHETFDVPIAWIQQMDALVTELYNSIYVGVQRTSREDHEVCNETV